MSHLVFLGPGSCEGHSLLARRFVAQWLKVEAVARGFDIEVTADDGLEGVPFVSDPDRNDGPQTGAWVSLTLYRFSTRLDHLDQGDVRPWNG
ncbi:MAG: hypothetical protein ACK5YI_13950 [Rhodospirillales bacterium]|jgi:hypothetical protein